MANMPLSADQEWLCYGHFDIDGTFIFDKKKVSHCVFTNIKEFRECPALDIDYTRRVLKAFPESVNPKFNKDWKYQDPIFRKLSTEIRICTGPDKDNIIEPIGVRPASIESADRIIKAILQKI
jgi:hypothetical protein